MTKTDTPTDTLGEQHDELFGTEQQLDEICRTLPRRSRSLAESRERDEAVFFADRDGGAAA